MTLPPAASAWLTEPAVGLCCERVRLRARRRLAWLALLGEADPVHIAVGDLDAPSAEATWQRETTEVAPWNAELAEVEQSLAALDDSRLARLVRGLGLGAAEADFVQLALAAAVDPGVRRLGALLAGSPGRGATTPEIAARLFGHGRTLVLSAESPVFAWEVLNPVEREGGGYELAPGLVRWLTGEDTLDDALVGRVARLPAERRGDWWPLDETVTGVRRALEGGARDLVLELHGPRGVGRRSFAAALAAELGFGLYVVDPGGLTEEPAARLVLRAHRQALLDRAVLAWTSPPPARRLPAGWTLRLLLSAPGEPNRAPSEHTSWQVRLEPPPTGRRAALWRAALPALRSDPGLPALAARYRATPGEIERASRRGPADSAEAALQLREAMRGGVGDLAQRLECPFGFDDLVVPAAVEAQLRDLEFEAGVRSEVWENREVARLFPQGRGLLALFCGPPGTGKTMSAQVLAASLGLDLFRVDLAAMVSKYVGETSKNIERVLASAARLDAILLFDEADALFGRRTEIKDAHDRFANTDTNYLLQAIEAWPGFAVLATNRRGNMDGAFIRRVRHIIDFPAPDARDRLRLWTRLLDGLAGTGTATRLAPTLAALATNLELSGAQIKFAVLHATLAARRVGGLVEAAQLVDGVDRELGKEGRGISRGERERLVARGNR